MNSLTIVNWFKNFIPCSCKSVRASFTSQMKTLGPVGSKWARFTVAVHAKLLAVGTLLATFGRRDGFLGPSCQTDSAKSARELAFLGLKLAVAARATQIDDLVKVLADRASL